jgi:hypothetical protein
MPTVESVRQLIEEAMRRSAELFMAAAQALVVLISAQPTARKELEEAGVSPFLLNNLIRLSAGQIHPKLLTASGRPAMKLKTLPLAIQTEVVERGVEVLSPNKTDHRVISLADMTPEQAKQAFDRSGIRSLAAQRTWIEATEVRLPRTEPVQNYRVSKTCVSVIGPCQLSKQELHMILMEMDRI